MSFFAREITVIIRSMRASGSVHDKLKQLFYAARYRASPARLATASLYIVKTVNYYRQHGAIRRKGTRTRSLLGNQRARRSKRRLKRILFDGKQQPRLVLFRFRVHLGS